tara:strand:+ start:14306 stop:14839 length:534 start_codon:yes stop_codon:yes gene_type:complete
MNYIIVIALLLGIISLIVTLKYIDQYDKLHKGLRSLSNKINGSEFPDELIEIQNKLNISDTELLDLLEKKKNDIIALLTKEGFINYQPIKNTNDTGIIQSATVIKSKTNKSNIPVGSMIPSNTSAIYRYNKPFDIDTIPEYNNKLACNVKTSYGNFCFNSLEKGYCPGEISNTMCSI